MPRVHDVLSEKGMKIHATPINATVLAAVQQMNQHKIGALIVMEGDAVKGMFTERDVLQRVIGAGRKPEETFVGEVMTTDIVCCGPQADLDDVATLMLNRRIRHVPVVDETSGSLMGLISIGDVNAYNASTQEATILYLNDYIYGRA